MAIRWPDMPLDQMITYVDVKDAIEAGYLVENNGVPGGTDPTKLITKVQFEYVCSNRVNSALAANQIVSRGDVT